MTDTLAHIIVSDTGAKLWYWLGPGYGRSSWSLNPVNAYLMADWRARAEFATMLENGSAGPSGGTLKLAGVFFGETE